MKSSEPDRDLPPALNSLWRTVKLGYSAEPKMLLLSFAMTLLSALPDALIALWLALLAHGMLETDRTLIFVAAIGLGISATMTWFLTIVFDRVQRRFRDKVAVALESHVARLQATVATVEHHERPDYLDRLAMLRDQVFALDHLFMSLFATAGWIIRLVITLVLLGSIHPALILLGLFAIPTVITSTWRPGVERRVEERAATKNRLARHLFIVGTTAPPGKEIRVSGNAQLLVEQRRAAWDAWYGPVATARWMSALWHCLAWLCFSGGYVGAVVFVADGLDGGTIAIILVLTAGSRLSNYVGAAVGELGFLRGIWLDSSRRLTWLEDYANRLDENADLDSPLRLTDGIRFENITFSYPGANRVVLDDVNLFLPAGAVIAVVGENGAGKSTLVKLLARLYSPDSGRILADATDIAKVPNSDWRSRLAGAFQDFYRFEFNAKTTVGLGDEPRIGDTDAIRVAIDRAGANDVIGHLPDGLDTQLGPTWDGGVEVSFGQWQKFALARGFMRDDPLVLILDEPTAALDAETEHSLFERFAAASRASTETNGRITVLVSHRFSTVRMADLIVVLDGSRVAEVGSHEELMANGGQYAELYAIQAAAYR